MSTENSSSRKLISRSTALNIIIGCSGNLGNEFLKFYSQPGESMPISRELTRSWISQNSIAEIEGYLRIHRGNREKANLFLCTGVTDPQNEIDSNIVNNKFPRNVVLACENLDIKVVTFGTIQEDWSLSNPYIESKRQFSEWLKKESPGFVRNFKLHTLYGGPRLDNKLFLSQIIGSLKSRTKFKMSTGLQIREYHHQSQVTAYVDYLLNFAVGNVPQHISHGNPHSLRATAEYLFNRFNLVDLLEFGNTIDVHGENFHTVYDRTIPDNFDPDFSLTSIGDWIEKRLYDKS